MADFNVVHRQALADAKAHITQHQRDCYNILLREPLGKIDDPIPESTYFITVMLNKDGNLCPVDKLSLKHLVDWQERHKDTPNEAFELFGGLTP